MRKHLIISLIFLALFLLVSIDVAFNGILVKVSHSINLAMPSVQKPIFISMAIFAHYFFGVLSMLFILLLVCIFLLIRKQKVKSAILALGTGFSALSLVVLKELFHQARPINALILENDFSYPSGHVLMTVVFFGLLISMHWDNLRKKGKMWAILVYTLLIGAVSFSRLYLNVHWLSDVIGSIFLGLFLVGILTYFYSLNNILGRKK
jgi:undecaprenyl-diphosphatase